VTSISANATACGVRASGPRRRRRRRASTRRSARARVSPSDRESTSRPRDRGCALMNDDDTDADDSTFFSEEPRSRHRDWVVIRCALLSRPLRSASVSDAGTRRRCSVTFSAVPAAKAAAKPRYPRPVRVPRALVGVLAARGTTFRARSARFVPRHGRSRAFSRDAATRPPDRAAVPTRH
jgi:hypothetical protein